MAGPTVSGTLLDAVTTTGRESIPTRTGVPSMTIFFVSISGGTATVAIEISDDGDFYIPVVAITESSAIQFAIPCGTVAANVTAIAGATVTVTYRTVILDNVPTDTLLVYNSSAEVRRPIFLPEQTFISAEAVTLLKLAQAQIAATATTVYTVPASTQARIEQLILSNPTGVDRIVALWHDGSTDAFNILPPTTIVAGGFATFNGIINMQPADTLVADCDAATAVTLTAYGYEQPVP